MESWEVLIIENFDLTEKNSQKWHQSVGGGL